MKKFLLTLIVMMLTFIGAWAQSLTFSPVSPLELEVGKTQTVIVNQSSIPSEWRWNADQSGSVECEVLGAATCVSLESTTLSGSFYGGFSMKLSGVSEGNATIKVVAYADKSNKEGEKYEATYVVNVVPGILWGTYAVGDANTFAGESTTVTPTISWPTTTEGTIEYEATSNNEGVATVEIAPDGKLTVTGVANGSTTVSVVGKKTVDGVVIEKVSGTVNVNIVAKPTFNGFNFSEALKSSIEFAEMYQPGASVSWTNADSWTQTVDVTSTSNVKAIFAYGYLYIYGLEAGDATITLTPKATSGGTTITGEAETINITVNPLTKELTLTPSNNLDVALNDASIPTKVATAIWKNSNGTVVENNDLTNADPTGQYSIETSNGNVTATIDKSGNITVTPVSVGETEVTVTATYKKSFSHDGTFDAIDTKTATFSVKVNPAVESGTYEAETANTFAGESTTVTPTISWPTTTEGTIEYEATSNNEGVATVEIAPDGKLTVTGVANGSTTVSVVGKKTVDGVVIEKVSGTVNVNVTDKPTCTFNLPDDLPSAMEFAATYTKENLTATWTNANSWTKDFKVDNDNEDVAAVLLAYGNLYIYGVNAGTAQITLTPRAVSGSTTLLGEPQTFTIEVKELTKELTLTPAGDVTYYIGEDIASKTASVVWKKSDGTAAETNVLGDQFTSIVSTNPEVATAALNANSGEITLTNVGVGETTVKVTATYKKIFRNANPSAGEEELAAITTATADFKINILPLSEETNVTVTKETVDGVEYYVVNVPEAGAFGPIRENPLVIYKDDTSLELLKNAPNVKVVGPLKNSDVQELVNVIGGLHETGEGGAATNTSKCVTLDMSQATMTEAVTSDGTYCSFVPSTQKYMGSVKNLVLPKPATDATVLPANFNTFFGSQNTLSENELVSLTIPEGWTEVADFFSTYNGNNATVFQKLTDLNLPNSLEKIGAYAFSGLRVQVLDMPYNIKRINKCAFNDCPKLQDVYFHGPAPEFVHTNAFAGQTQYCNNTVKDAQLQGIVDPVITRKEYYNGSGDNLVYACILHYPAKYRDDYIDTSREYKVIPANQAYSKGNTTGESNKYNPGWTPEFKTAVETALNAMPEGTEVDKANRDPNSKFEEDYMVDYGVKDAYYGYSMIWPSQSQMTTGFAIAQAGYQWGGQPLDPVKQYNPESSYYDTNHSVDKRGLYQFIVGMSNAEIDFKFEQDKWYTISLAFDMSPEQVKEVFGDKTQVCRFSKAVREVVETEEVSKKIITLEFRNSVMCENDGRPDGTSYQADRLTDAGTYTGIRHHYPYMIKPLGTITDKYIVEENGLWHFYGDGFKGVSGFLEDDNVTPEDTEGNPAAVDFVYSFCPVLMQGEFKPYSYVFVNNKGTHQYVFYRGVKAKDEHDEYVIDNGYYVYTKGGTANQNTAYVQLTAGALGVGQDKNYGVEDYKVFFPAMASSGSPESGVKAVKSLFGDDVDDDANMIEEVVIVCGTDEVEDNKVYTIGGQLVNSNSLPAGLYIKNGKKFIVK